MGTSIFLDVNLPNAATWFYFSLLLAVALFFKFSRLLSMRNLDLALIFLPVPGLLLLFANRLIIAVPAAIFGYCTFLLGLERTAWIGWVVGIVIILILSRPRVRINIVAALVGGVIREKP